MKFIIILALTLIALSSSSKLERKTLKNSGLYDIVDSANRLTPNINNPPTQGNSIPSNSQDQQNPLTKQPVNIQTQDSVVSSLDSLQKLENPNGSNPSLSSFPPSQGITDPQAKTPIVNPQEEAWKNIFSDISRKECPEITKNATISGFVDSGSGVNGIRASQPRKAADVYSTLEIGYGNSAYLFDYLDELLLPKVIESFTKLVESVKLLPKDKGANGYEDPYSLKKMLSLPENDASSDIQLIEKLKKANPLFSDTAWEASFNAVQISEAIKQNNWSFLPGTADPAKKMVDKFDFNGDGRLSNSELIIAVIDANKEVYGQNKCKNCLEEIVVDIIDPIFLFADCSGNGKMSSEDAWKALRYLKRTSEKYNIYLCQSEGEFVRTNSMNEFVLKAHKAFPGKLLREEFRLAVLIGYWSRQTDKGAIVNDNSKNRKTDRWSNPDGKDNLCIE